jgi:uncharacterized DUF497 family protein
MFEWDEDKRLNNAAKHGIDFLTACALFDGRPVYTFATPRGDEERFATVGLIEGRFVTVVWTPRRHKTRLISARRSRDEEKKAYRQLFGG